MRKRMKRYIAILTLVPVLFLCGCNELNVFDFNIIEEVVSEEPAIPSTEITPTEPVELPENMNEGYVQFSVELLKRSIAEGENSMISPASVHFALNMAAMGSEDKTLEEMIQVLCPGATLEEITEYSQALSLKINQSQHVSFYVANSMWANETLIGNVLSDDYVKALEEEMNAQAEILPFNNDAVEKINTWVNENTAEMIPTLLEEIPEDTVMYLINAMSFEGEWADQYDDYQVQEKIFTNAAGTEETADMLCETGSNYLESDEATGFLKYYKGGEYAFLAILPDEGMTTDEYIEDLTAEEYLEFYNSLTTEYDVVSELPCFSYSYDLTMNDALKDMGMPTAFDKVNADFSPMVTDENAQLYIDQVLHKTYIELDQHGTRAAAVTSVAMKLESAMMEQPEIKYVILDRPFVYAIVDTETGAPIFMGTVNTLSE